MSRNLSELEDKLGKIKTALAELRATTADGPAFRKQLDSIFRRVHTLKATAAADGLTDLHLTAHELENLLQAKRDGLPHLGERDHLLFTRLGRYRNGRVRFGWLFFG